MKQNKCLFISYMGKYIWSVNNEDHAMKCFGSECREIHCMRIKGEKKTKHNKKKKPQINPTKTSEFWKRKWACGKNTGPSGSQEYLAADWERSCLCNNHQIASLSLTSWPSSSPLGAVVKPSFTSQKLKSALLFFTALGFWVIKLEQFWYDHTFQHLHNY